VRRLAVIAIVACALAVGFVGGRWLVGPSAPVPSASNGDPTSSPVRAAGLPDPRHTPGVINPAVTQDNLASTICKPRWTQTIRPPSAYTSALKVAQILEYGYSDRDPRHYQEDHLVALELGGAPRDPRNLWPEPNATVLDDGTAISSREKDDLEAYLHTRVCAGTMAVADAQRSIAGNWIAAWTAAGGP
jgi:hypothetical protein